MFVFTHDDVLNYTLWTFRNASGHEITVRTPSICWSINEAQDQDYLEEAVGELATVLNDGVENGSVPEGWILWRREIKMEYGYEGIRKLNDI